VIQTIEKPKLADAQSLLRVARDQRHVDEHTRGLSKGAINLNDLNAKPDSNDGKPRSFSTMMLCNQATETLLAAAAAISRSDEFRAEPIGAASALAEIQSIDFDGRDAFELLEEEEEGLPGHVSVRFAAHARALSDANQRNLRDALVRAFGQVKLITEIRSERCESL
jgi:hypothetical protein